MTSTTRKPPKRGKKNRTRPAKAARSRGQTAYPAELPSELPRELPVRQGLVEMATIGAQSFLWLATLVTIAVALVGAAFAIWSLRPVPSYYSARVTIGSAFAVNFRVENKSPWFAISRLKIRCMVDGIDAPDMPPVEADVSRIPERLGPGAEAIFTCPFRAADPGVAQRSELWFRSEYDLAMSIPLLDRLRLSNTSGPYVLDMKLLPPRWTAKPGRD